MLQREAGLPQPLAHWVLQRVVRSQAEAMSADEAQQLPAAVAPSHPAKWSRAVLDTINELWQRYEVPGQILDPFAGVGLPQLREVVPVDSILIGVEIEEEWAAASGAWCGSALNLPWTDPMVDALVTSPCYGNRMADCHEAKDDSSRITYRHKLGRMPTEGSAGVLQWGQAYRTFHEQAWAEALRVLKSRALVAVNISNHIRHDVEQRVTEWHLNAWLQLGATIEEVIKVPTPRMGFGANGDKRTDGERLLVLRAPAKPTGSML